MTTACAVCAAAASSALALAIVLCCRSLHHDGGDVALLSLDDHGVSLLGALALVRAVAVSALVRHGELRKVFETGKLKIS